MDTQRMDDTLTRNEWTRNVWTRNGWTRNEWTGHATDGHAATVQTQTVHAVLARAAASSIFRRRAQAAGCVTGYGCVTTAAAQYLHGTYTFPHMRAAISTVMGQGKTAETYTLGAGDPCMCGLWRRQNIDDTRQSAQSAVYRVIRRTDDGTIPMARHRASTPSIPQVACRGSVGLRPTRSWFLSSVKIRKVVQRNMIKRFNSSDDVSLLHRGHEIGVMRSRSTTPAMRWAMRLLRIRSSGRTIWCCHVNDAHDGAFRRASPVKAQEEGKAASRPRGDQEEPKRELYEARAKGSMCMQRKIISFAAAAAFSTPPWSQTGPAARQAACHGAGAMETCSCLCSSCRGHACSCAQNEEGESPLGRLDAATDYILLHFPSRESGEKGGRLLKLERQDVGDTLVSSGGSPLRQERQTAASAAGAFIHTRLLVNHLGGLRVAGRPRCTRAAGGAPPLDGLWHGPSRIHRKP
ncbi:hypothetical protein THAOC_10257 [Thalassiosira oceanica]|uniref:Uncharacterized protein n=1 Tax=Thalassiosira oceanica TaxID=159749 RepID=K0T5F1_THAOC|nr:hypothetical protein THAOC_10257 [Thalassiosira oceanica]|eukprot:EJK68551.1 hypothetical protein THAOC_10257 [Thalassiosira oceanica]